jgi:hypothetical protein
MGMISNKGGYFLELNFRNSTIQDLLRKIDITPTMHKYAVERYQGIATYLESQGIRADIYPQGSFRLGTVVRPLVNGKESDFDLDTICELIYKKSETTPRDIKHMVGNALNNSEVYKDKLLPEDERCWTLQYAKVDKDTGLMLDIVPSVHEDVESINNLVLKSVKYDYAKEAISITQKGEKAYFWQDSNPKGYASWFDDINKPYLEQGKDERRRAIFNENRNIYASIDEIPDIVDRSSLQRVIQLLKRHRDVYYFSYGTNVWSKRPISAIITTLTAQIAKFANPALSIVELADFTATNLLEYAKLLDSEQIVFKGHLKAYFFEARDYLSRENQKWRIPNPVNPNDNYADTWDNDTAKMFFQWVKRVYSDFNINNTFNENQYYGILENAMGSDLVASIKPKKQPAPHIITNPTKPWASNE